MSTVISKDHKTDYLGNYSLSSPDRLIRLYFELASDTTTAGVPSYRVEYKGQTLIKPSRLGLVLEDAPSLLDGFEAVDLTTESVDEEWKPWYGERDQVKNRYNGFTITLREKTGEFRHLKLEFRVYNEGVAFRYLIPEQASLARFVIAAERSEFHFPAGCYGYEEHGAEGEYHKVLIKDIQPYCERPLTVEYPSGKYLCLTEAGLDNYSRMLLSSDEINPWMVVSTLSGLITQWVGYGMMNENLTGEAAWSKVVATTPFASPWRVLIVGEKPGDLLERNDLILSLNSPSEIQDTSWIIPGKILRDVVLSNQSAAACADFALKLGFDYLLLDGGWYGNPFDDRSDATQLENEVWSFHKKEGGKYHSLNVKEYIREITDRGLGVFLYLDRRAVENQLDELLPLYKEWGVKGLKFGFVNTGPQQWTKWLMEAVRKCARYGLLVNIHDAYRPTGFSRTYPNLLTQEGIRGNEHFPTARHNTTLPFTRFPAGAGDYTVCFYSPKKQTTYPHQLAMSVIVYSPLQSIFWYDHPSDYQGEPEVEFFARVPTVWNDTKVLLGSIGEYAAIARRKDREWFIGCITNEQGRELSLPLDFLETEKPYIASIYGDDFQSPASSRTKTAIMIREVTAEIVLQVRMAPSGGQAIHLAPKGN